MDPLMSLAVQLAETVVNELNAASFSQAFTATRNYLPLFELSEFKTLRVTVMPGTTTLETRSRQTCQQDSTIEIAIQHKLADCENTTIDPLLGLVEEIADHFRFRRFSTPDVIWIKTENEPQLAQEHLDQFRVFTSLLTLTFRALR